jgi:hypothetical protein
LTAVWTTRSATVGIPSFLSWVRLFYRYDIPVVG